MILDASSLRISISEGDNPSLCQKERSEKLTVLQTILIKNKQETPVKGIVPLI